ncbi:MAG: exopolysaccharide biosynthesis protein [Rickettsiales bacterium]|nr:exopolysaccharide biosynthesis protein [Rickettsiales bacterium]
MQQTEGKSLIEKLYILQGINQEKISILEINEILGRNAIQLLVAFFVLPMLLPVTAFPGLSQIISLILILLLVQLIIGKRIVWLPKKVRFYKIDKNSLLKITNLAIKYHHKFSNFLRPRYLILSTISFNKFHYLYLIFVVLVMALPIPAPFANTIPAISIILISIGIVEREGASIIIGYIFGLLGTAYMVLMIILGKEFYSAIF